MKHGAPIATLLALTALPGCDPRADMAEAARLRPFEPVGTTTSSSVPPAGTVPWRDQDDPRAESTVLRPSDARARLERGRRRFDIFCAPCHGRDGYGQGAIPAHGFPSPPSFHTPELRAQSDDHIAQVIADGLGVMPSYRAQVPPEDRRAIIAYIRALQFSQWAPVDAVPTGVDPLPFDDFGETPP